MHDQTERAGLYAEAGQRRAGGGAVTPPTSHINTPLSDDGGGSGPHTARSGSGGGSLSLTLLLSRFTCNSGWPALCVCLWCNICDTYSGCLLFPSVNSQHFVCVLSMLANFHPHSLTHTDHAPASLTVSHTPAHAVCHTCTQPTPAYPCPFIHKAPTRALPMRRDWCTEHEAWQRRG